jgi:parvulin-like peptidyl-prolyl isomerase
MPTLRAAVLGVALTGVSLYAQTPAAQPTQPAAQQPAQQVKQAAAANAVAATVNGHPIYEAAVQRALERAPKDRREEFRPILIDHLANNLLIDLSLRHAGYKVEKAEVDKKVEDMKAHLKKANQDFDKMLADLKVPETELREHIEADLRWFKYASAQATDAALKKTFDDNKEMFDGSRVLAQHILITPKDKEPRTAEAAAAALRDYKAKIEQEVAAGLAKLPASTDKLAAEKERLKLVSDTFAKYAAEKSDCTATKTNRGLVGPFPKGGPVGAPFANAAFKLQPGQMSDPVLTPYGYHLILCVDRKAPEEVKFEAVKDYVKELFFDLLIESTAKHLRSQAQIVVAPQK